MFASKNNNLNFRIILNNEAIVLVHSDFWHGRNLFFRIFSNSENYCLTSQATMVFMWRHIGTRVGSASTPQSSMGGFRVAKPASCSQFTPTSLVSHTRWCFLQGHPGPEQHLLLISSTTFFGLKEGHCLVILWNFSLAYSLTRWKNHG
jgi:hypothetical protein